MIEEIEKTIKILSYVLARSFQVMTILCVLYMFMLYAVIGQAYLNEIDKNVYDEFLLMLQVIMIVSFVIQMFIKYMRKKHNYKKYNVKYYIDGELVEKKEFDNAKEVENYSFNKKWTEIFVSEMEYDFFKYKKYEDKLIQITVKQSEDKLLNVILYELVDEQIKKGY